MQYRLIRDNVAEKWKNYQKYIPIIFKKMFTLIEDHQSNDSATIILIDDQQMHQMNAQYRKIDRPTDILTFISDEDDYLGDIFINVDALTRQAKEYGHTLKREFCFLVAHGALHLMGYDHHTPQEEKEMFALQEELLKDIAPRHEKV